MSGIVLQNFQHLMQWINLNNATNTIRLGETVRQFGESIIDSVSPLRSPPAVDTVVDPSTGCSPVADNSNSRKNLFPGFGHQMFNGVHNSIQDLYDEWYGLGKYKNIPIEGGIEAMERLYSSKWRMGRNDKGFPKRFSRIRMVIAAINERVANGANGTTVAQVIKEMDYLYQNDAQRKLSPFVEKVLVCHNYRVPTKKPKIT